METTDLDTKLTQLKIAVEKTGSVLDSGKKATIKRHLETLLTIVKETSQCKTAAEAKKIAEKTELSVISDWSKGIDSKLEQADSELCKLGEWVAEDERKQKLVAQEEQFKFELKLHEQKLKMQAELANVSEPKPETQECEVSTEKMAKLLKLVITKFEGSYMDWPRFWGQFTEAIDKSSIAPISKFTYLSELLSPKVKRCIEALPFTTEGYNRAKAVLKDKYGKESEIINCYVKEILELPHIPSVNPRKISEFSDKLTYCVQALETMGSLGQINGNVSMTLEKLSGIRGDLVRTDPEWEAWDFVKLTEAIRQWVKRNPIISTERDRDDNRDNRKKLLNARHVQVKPRGCIYCGDMAHKANQCTNVTDVSERKGILSKKGLCFNCATKLHRAAECTSKVSCGRCSKRHHTSICELRSDKPQNEQKLLTDGSSGDGIFPVVVVKINGVICRALIDSGAGSSYASSKLINTLNLKPSEVKVQRIDMLLGTQTSRMGLYDTTVSSIDGSFKMNVKLTKVEKGELLSINNPKYEKLIQRYRHLDAVHIDDHDKKQRLPIHVILGSGEYARIKTSTQRLVGSDREPVAEKTKLGWFIMSPGMELDKNTMLMTQTSQADFENLCRLDVLGLADTMENDQDAVYDDFKEQLVRHSDGWYETNLPWKPNHPTLPTNEIGSLRRLNNLVKRLERAGDYQRYDDIIMEQLEQGVIERAPAEPTGNEFYIPHKGVTKNTAETTKLRVVYDASAKESNDKPSLNECLNPGPPLQNLLWSVLVRSRFHPVLVTSDIEKAFLQVRIKEQERDSLRFHWRASGSDEVCIYRFTRALFGLICSPFLLGGVIHEHLKTWEETYPDVVKEIREGLYVDDLMTGGANVNEVKDKKIKTSKVFEDAAFKLHKWHSNVDELEERKSVLPCDEGGTTYAKQQLGVDQSETRILGLPWDKKRDTLSVVISKGDVASSKRTALSQLAKVYDPLGLISPATLLGKMLYREICEANLAWDSDLPEEMKKRWKEWYSQIPEHFAVPRALAPHHQPVLSLSLHAFGDASKNGVSAAVYAVVEQEEGITQGLVCPKSRLAKRDLTIPRLELVAGHMAVNLATNVEEAVGVEKVSAVHCWLDSTVALYWIGGHGEYRQFVANRVKKIQEHKHVKWHHVSTHGNPADLGSRGGQVIGNKLWECGPAWLSDPTKWPSEVTLTASAEANQEVKRSRDKVFTTSSKDRDEFDSLIERFPLRKALRIGAWTQRFLRNCRSKANNESGPLKTSEIEEHNLWWIRRVQREAQNHSEYEKIKLHLNLQPNQSGILECRGRIEGEYPIFLPENCIYTQKLVEQEHLSTLHGGVAATMAQVREHHWVPKLRQLVKRIRSNCSGCIKFRTQAYHSPPPGNLPPTRTEGSTPFEVLRVDFAGPIRYQTKAKATKKAYLVLFGCSLTRAVHLELLKSLEVTEFLPSLKRLIARRGRPKIIYSDNAKTFKAAEKWLKRAQKEEILHAFLADRSIKWRFNLRRAPWWGGQFERLIGLFKRAFYKTIGNGILTWEELDEVVIDIEVALNNRPLTYLEDDVALPVLTPNSMLNINASILPEQKPHCIDDRDLRKRARFLNKCKAVMWRRWSREYVRNLRERHHQLHGKKISHPKPGDVVIVQDDEKNRNLWKMGIVVELMKGRDDVVRAAKVKTAKGYLERAIQHRYPMELSCDENKTKRMDPNTPTFVPRQTRDAAAAANLRIQQTAEDEGEEN